MPKFTLLSEIVLILEFHGIFDYRCIVSSIKPKYDDWMLLVLHNLYKMGKSNENQLSNFGLIDQLLPRPQK